MRIYLYKRNRMRCIRLYMINFGLIWYIYILVTRQQLTLLRCCLPALFRRLFMFNSTRGIRVAVINTVQSLHNSFSFSLLFFWLASKNDGYNFSFYVSFIVYPSKDDGYGILPFHLYIFNYQWLNTRSTLLRSIAQHVIKPCYSVHLNWLT